jgi:hypothetical protein
LHQVFWGIHIDFLQRFQRHLAVVFLFLLFFCFFYASTSFADSFYPNAGVDTTDGAATIPFRHSQWLLNTEWDEFRDTPRSTVTYLAFLYGFAENMDLGIQLPYTDIFKRTVADRSLNDVQFGMKYRFTPEKDGKILVSTILSAKPPTSGPINDVNNGVWDFSAHLVGTYQVNKWAYNANYGYSFWGNIPDNPRKPSPYYKFEGTYNFSDKYSLSGEIYGQKGPDVSPLQTTIKTSYQIRPSLTLDVGIALGLNNDAPVRRYLMGLTWDR